MVKTKRKFPVIITPRSPLKWCHLHKPDQKFNPDGDYRVTVELPAEGDIFSMEGEPYSLSLLKKLRDDFYIKLAEEKGLATKKTKGKKVMKKADLPWKVEEDDEGQETGNILITPKMKAIVRFKKNGQDDFFEQRPDIIDAGMKPVSEKIGGGSEGRVKFEVVPYYTPLLGMGITLRLKVVQVLELVPFGGTDLTGFDKEDGFESGGEADAAGPSDDDDEGDF